MVCGGGRVELKVVVVTQTMADVVTCRDDSGDERKVSELCGGGGGGIVMTAMVEEVVETVRRAGLAGLWGPLRSHLGSAFTLCRKVVTR